MKPRTLAPKIRVPPVELHDDSKMTMLFKQQQTACLSGSCMFLSEQSEVPSENIGKVKALCTTGGDEPALGKHTGW